MTLTLTGFKTLSGFKKYLHSTFTDQIMRHSCQWGDALLKFQIRIIN